MSNLKTGYFATILRSTKVHLVDKNNQPICGSVIKPDMEFQWCAHGIVPDYITCDSCQNRAREIITDRFHKSIQK